MESKKYLKATLKGLIEKFDLKNIAPNATEYYIEGKNNHAWQIKKYLSPKPKLKKVAAG
jgi:hypothetical protein